MTKQKNRYGTTLFVIFLIAAFATVFLNIDIGRVSVQQGGSTGSGIAMKSQDRDCLFRLEAAWSPAARDDVRVAYVFREEKGNPRVAISPWSITRKAPCSSGASVAVNQSVHSARRVGCTIMVDNVVVSRYTLVRTRAIRCSW